MRGMRSILSLFRNDFNKFNNTRARMLDSIKITLKSHCCRKNVIILSLCTQRIMFPKNLSTTRPSGLSILMALIHSETRRHTHIFLNLRVKSCP